MLSESMRVASSDEIMAFAGNDAIRCRLVNVGLSGLCLVSPFARESGGFIRIQTQLGAGVWLDTDGILVDCVRAGAEWRWEVRFTRLEESQKASLERYVRDRPAAAQDKRPPLAKEAGPRRPFVRVLGEAANPAAPGKRGPNDRS